MRTIEEIRERLDMAIQEFDHLEEWAISAHHKYQEEKRIWGKDADRGEMMHVRDLQSNFKKEISTLKWVLNEQPSTQEGKP